METLRKWMMTLAALALGVGVLLSGLRGWLPEAQAESGSPGAVCDTMMLTKGTVAGWMNEQRAAGRQRFLSPSASGMLCAW